MTGVIGFQLDELGTGRCFVGGVVEAAGRIDIEELARTDFVREWLTELRVEMDFACW